MVKIVPARPASQSDFLSEGEPQQETQEQTPFEIIVAASKRIGATLALRKMAGWHDLRIQSLRVSASAHGRDDSAISREIGEHTLALEHIRDLMQELS